MTNRIITKRRKSYRKKRHSHRRFFHFCLTIIAAMLFALFVFTPSLNLRGGDYVTVEAGLSFDDKGAFIRFLGFIELPTDFEIEGFVDSSKIDNYTLKYTARHFGRKLSCVRNVSVKDTKSPVINLVAPNESSLVTTISKWEDPGYSAEDAFEGELTDKVKVEMIPDTESKVCTVIYRLSDSSGNTAEAKRTFKFEKADIQSGGENKEITKPATPDSDANTTVSDGDSVIYLTFDDGPSAGVTPRILDTLLANNVKATFFIINYSDTNKTLVKRAIDEGHSVGIHGYSHSYDVIYASDEAFIDNITKLHDRLLSDFDYDSKLMRFPGGSSNSISAKHNTGIMSRLCPKMESLGYAYFDWNVSSGDADEKTASAYYIVNGVTSGVKKGRANVVLMHDSSTKTTTADALQEIIDFGKKNGFTFSALQHNSPTAHHRINN